MALRESSDDHQKLMSDPRYRALTHGRAVGGCSNVANQCTVFLVLFRGSCVMIETEKVRLVKAYWIWSILNILYLWTVQMESFGCNLAQRFLASRLFPPFKGWFPICLRHRHNAMIIHSTGTLYRRTEVISWWATGKLYFHNCLEADAISPLAESPQLLGVLQ